MDLAHRLQMPKDLLDAMHVVLMADAKLSWHSMPFFLGSMATMPKRLSNSMNRDCSMLPFEEGFQIKAASLAHKAPIDCRALPEHNIAALKCAAIRPCHCIMSSPSIARRRCLRENLTLAIDPLLPPSKEDFMDF